MAIYRWCESPPKCGISWYFMVFHGISWYFMGYRCRRPSWKRVRTMETSGALLARRPGSPNLRWAEELAKHQKQGSWVFQHPMMAGWWFQPLWKISVSWDYEIPNIGMGQNLLIMWFFRDDHQPWGSLGVQGFDPPTRWQGDIFQQKHPRLSLAIPATSGLTNHPMLFITTSPHSYWHL